MGKHRLDNFNVTYGKRCGRCAKYRQSRAYYKPIKGKLYKPDQIIPRKICKECWDELEQLPLPF